MVKLAVLLVTIIVFFGYDVESKKMVQLSPEILAGVIQSSVMCSSKAGVDPLQALKNREENNIDAPTKKFMLCVFVDTGIAKKNGNIKTSKFLNVYPENVDKDEIKPVVEECRQNNGTPEDKIVKFLECFKEKSPVLINFG